MKEWVADHFGHYTPEAKVDPPGPPKGIGGDRVLRGGNSTTPHNGIFGWSRSHQAPQLLKFNVGIRVARGYD